MERYLTEQVAKRSLAARSTKEHLASKRVKPSVRRSVSTVRMRKALRQMALYSTAMMAKSPLIAQMPTASIEQPVALTMPSKVWCPRSLES